jgi:Phosphoesterase family
MLKRKVLTGFGPRVAARIGVGVSLCAALIVAPPAAVAQPRHSTRLAVAANSQPPAYSHVVLAIFENKARSQIIGARNAPYLTGLAAQGANFTQSFALRHPSQPNYLDLFSGSNQGVADNSCPHTFASGNLGHQLIASGRTFVGYAEDLPSAGSAVCDSGRYARRHVPWANFSNLHQTTVTQPYSAFPTDFTRLPTVSWIVPNNCNNMHDGPAPNCWVSTGDMWARRHLDAYAQWAKTHNSLLIVTWDEDDGTPLNHIATFFVGARINPGNYSERIDHFTVLRTIEAMYGLPGLGSAAQRSAITDVFAAAPTAPPPTITGMSQARRRWRLGNNLARLAAAPRPPVGTNFKFTLNQPATVRLVFDEQLPGRRVNGRCVAQTARNRRNRACTRSVSRGSFSFNAGAGQRTLFFQGRLNRTRRLNPGTYALTITATNSAGQRASRTFRSFTIVR